MTRREQPVTFLASSGLRDNKTTNHHNYEPLILMTILGIGIDILHLPRLRSLIARRGAQVLAKRILCPREMEEFRGIGVKAESDVRYLAARWTAKEAAYKACYPSLKLTWKDLDLSKVDGKPVLGTLGHLHEDETANPALHISISHDGEYVVANVLAEAK